MHIPHLIAELRSLPPEDGWARSEATGRACLVCACGTSTGFIDKADALREAEQHPATTQADDDRTNCVTQGQPIKVEVNLAGASTEFVDLVRRFVRREK
jgi:hypothetical protein